MAVFTSEQRRLQVSDEELARRLGDGHVASFDELYRRYAPPLADFATRRLRDRATGEDVAQTTLLNALTAIQRGTRPLHVRAWLYRIAENATYEAHRKRGDIAVGREEEARDDGQDAPFEREALLAGVKDMPQRQRDVFVLRELSGFSITEISERLDLTSNQVEQALFLARNRLSEQLIFGERLSCDRLRALDLTGLTKAHRRAVKSHLRSCPGCRRATAGRVGFGLSTLGSLLRQAVELLPGGAAPVAAKLGAVAATAIMAAGAPVAASSLVHELSGKHPDAPRAVVPTESVLPPGGLAKLATLPFLGLTPAPHGSPLLAAGSDPFHVGAAGSAADGGSAAPAGPAPTDAAAPPDGSTDTSSADSSDPSANDSGSTDTSGAGTDASTDPSADPSADPNADPAADPTADPPSAATVDPAALDPTPADPAPVVDPTPAAPAPTTP